MADIGYYQPYESESESDTGSEPSGSEDTDESEYWSTSEEEEALITSPVSLLRNAGPAFANQQDALLDSRTNPYSSVSAAFAAPAQMGNVNNGITYGTTKFDIQAKQVDSIINIASQDRDYAVYSNPTAFTLHLPRVYKNVTNFDIQQIKFLNAFYYFRNDKFNTFYDYIEVGRTQGSVDELKLRVNIREGSYNITSLLQELQYQLNTPPLFFYYFSGFEDFAPLFSASGNYSFNFNNAGSYYFDSLLNTFIANPTTEQIIKHYFSSTNAGLEYYDLNRTLNAYFYPVIKEVFLDPIAFSKLDLTNPEINNNLLGGETLESRILYNFQGLDDPVTLAIIEDNREFLELYRTDHTYLYAPINEYGFRVDSFNQRVTIYATSLQKSILSYMSNSLCNAYREQYIANGLDVAGVQYNSLVSSNNKLLSIITQMKDYVYNQMSMLFAVPFNTYTIQQLMDYTTLYNFQSGFGVCNIVNSNTYWQINSTVIPASNFNTTSPTKTQYDSYISTTCNYFILNDNINKNYQIDVDSVYVSPDPNTSILTNNPLLDPLYSYSNLYVNPKKRSLDIICDINPYEYCVYNFKSLCRQTIQIETIPIPNRLRYFSNTQEYGTTLSNYFTVSNYFSNSHPYLDNIQTNFTAITPNLTPLTLPVVFGENFFTAESAAAFNNLSITKKYGLATFTMPNNPTYTGTLHNIKANISITCCNFGSGPGGASIYVYADRASYLNDVYVYYNLLQNNSNLLSNLSSNYIYSNDWNSSQFFFPTELQNNTDYYIIVSLNSNFLPPPLQYRMFVYFDTPTPTTRPITYDTIGNPAQSSVPFYFQYPESNARMYKFTNVYTNFDYYLIYDYVYNRLPINSNTLFLNNPSCNFFNTDLLNGYNGNDLVPIGYDSNGVSQDLTDYKGFSSPSNIQTSVLRIDPTNNYLFEYLTPYSSDFANCNSYLSYYFGTTFINSNKILKPTTAEIYYYDVESYIYTDPKRQYKIVHWHDQCHIPPQQFDTSNAVIGGTRKNYANYVDNFSSNISPYLNSYIDFVISLCNWSFGSTPVSSYSNTPFSSCNNFINNLGGIGGICFLPTDGTWDIESFMFKSAYCNSSGDPNMNIEHIGVFHAQTVSKYSVADIKLSNALFKLDRSNAVYYNDSTFINDSNFGFDCNYGSYHMFQIDSTTCNDLAVGRLPGYTQMYNKAVIDERAYYVLIPFTSASNITTYTMLCGSLVANPDLSVPGSNKAVATSFNSSNGAFNPYQGRSVNTNPYYLANCNAPNYIPRTVSDPDGHLGIEVSKYQQSLPIVTQPIQIIQSNDYITLSNPNYTYVIQDGYVPPMASHTFQLTYAFNPDGDNRNICLVPGGIKNTSNCSNLNVVASSNGLLYSNSQNSGIINYSSLIGSLPAISGYTSCNIIGFSEASNKRMLIVDYTGITPNRYEYYNIDNFYSSPSVGSSLGYFSNTSNYNYGSNYFFINNTPTNFSGDLIYHINYNATNTVLMVQCPSPSGLDYSNYVYLDVLPGITTITAAHAQCSDTNPANTSILFMNNDVGSLQTNLYIFNGGTNSGVGNSCYFNRFIFPAGYQGKILDAKIDQYNPDKIYFIYADDPYHLYCATRGTFTGSTAILNVNGDPARYYEYSNYDITIEQSEFTFTNSLADPSFSWTIGYGNCFFYKWDIGSPWTLEGTTNNISDASYVLQTLYNWFYPNMKITLYKKTNSYNPITDVSNLLSNPYDSNIFTPQFGRTRSFFYKTGADFSNDIVNTAVFPNEYKWGMETSNNYYKADSDSAGYVFGSYIYNITLEASDSNELRYLAIRGERPTEQFSTMLRIVAPERVDFGFVAMSNIFNEISNIYYPASGGTPSFVEKVCNYNPDYAANLSNFDQAFAMSNRYFGGGEVSNFYGVPITTSNNPAVSSNFFVKFMSNLSNYYSTYSSNLTIISNIQCNANSNFLNNILFNYQSIFPYYVFSRQKLSEPVEFNLLFADSIPEGRYKALDEGWGLGWNLGFEKSNYSNDTVYTAESFYKIFEDYIYLRLNPEQNMNRVDFTSREHLDRTLDTQGTIQTYYGKLLLNTFGNYGTTFVGNPVEFNPPIPRLDKLQIQWLDAAGEVLDNPDCEWNAIIHITENTPTATVSSTIPTLTRIQGAQQQQPQQKKKEEEEKKVEEEKKKVEEEKNKQQSK